MVSNYDFWLHFDILVKKIFSESIFAIFRKKNLKLRVWPKYQKAENGHFLVDNHQKYL